MVWQIVIVPAHPYGGVPGIEQVGRGQALHVAVAEKDAPSASVPPPPHRPDDEEFDQGKTIFTSDWLLESPRGMESNEFRAARLHYSKG
jgi:hypothetical protein